MRAGEQTQVDRERDRETIYQLDSVMRQREKVSTRIKILPCERERERVSTRIKILPCERERIKEMKEPPACK